MPEDKRQSAGAAALAISVPTAIGLAWALLKGQKAGDLVIPDEVIQLLMAMAATSEDTKEAVQEILAKVEMGDGGVGQGWPANANTITALRVLIDVNGTQLPSVFIPSGMSLAIKAWALNPGWLQVGATVAECFNVNQSFPLLPNEVVTYQVENADQIYIAATAAGCFACLTVEQKRQGGG